MLAQVVTNTKLNPLLKEIKKNVKQRTKIIRKMSKNPIHHLKLA